MTGAAERSGWTDSHRDPPLARRGDAPAERREGRLQAVHTVDGDSRVDPAAETTEMEWVDTAISSAWAWPGRARAGGVTEDLAVEASTRSSRLVPDPNGSSIAQSSSIRSVA